MTSALSLLAPGTSATPSAAAKPDDLATLARTASVETLTIYARQHPQERGALETAMVKAGRTGDVSQMSQALKKPDFEVPIWMRYGQTGGGPTYSVRPTSDPAHKVGASLAWNTLESSGQVTPSERAVISHMSASEGRLDSVQAYDNQIVSLGAMQKTVNPQGTGELPRQVWDFKQANPDKYQALFADRGWAVERVAPGSTDGSFAMRLTVDGTQLTPRETAAYIKDRGSPDHWGAALDPLLKAGRDPDFQAQQIKDFQSRLTTAISVIPAGAAYTRPAGEYLTSQQGAAMLLDHHVNRPAHVDNAFGRALDRFYAANPTASHDPGAWTAEQRAEYEPAILSEYRQARSERYGGGVMTHPFERADRLMGPDSPLSADPGSFVRTAPR